MAAAVSATSDIIGSFQIVISNATINDAQAIKLHGLLVDKGYTVFQQQTGRFAKDSPDWKREWYPNAQAATLIVCLLSLKYITSEACATEFRVAEAKKKLMVVCLDPADIGSFKSAVDAIDTKAIPSASGPAMFVSAGGQLTASDGGLEVVAAEVAKVMQNRGITPKNATASTPGDGGGGSVAMAFLEPLNLSTYAPAFDEQGVDSLDMLEGMSIDEYMTHFEMTRFHANKLKREVDKQTSAQAPPSPAPPASAVAAAAPTPAAPPPPAPAAGATADDRALMEWARQNPSATVFNMDAKWNGKKITDVGAQALAGACPNLTWISFSSTQVADVGAAACPNLTTIHLDNTQVTDVGAQALAAGCPNLTSIGLSNTQVTDVGAQALAGACPNLTEIYLSSTQVTDVGAQALAGACPKLTTIYLANTQVTDVGAQALADACPNLTHIGLSDTQVTDVGAQALAAACPNLIEIDLQDTQVTDVGAQALADACPNLTMLTLDGTQVTDGWKRQMEATRPELGITEYLYLDDEPEL